MRNRHWKVRKPSGSWVRFGEGLTVSFKQQNLPIFEDVSLSFVPTYCFIFTACPPVCGMESCPSTAEQAGTF